MEHEVVLDYAGFGMSYLRLTCTTCNVTCLKKPYMSLAQWIEAMQDFDDKHPSRMVGVLLERTRRLWKLDHPKEKSPCQ